MSHRDDFRERRAPDGSFGAPDDQRHDPMHDDPHDDTRDGDAEEGAMDALDRLILGAAAEYHAPPAAPPREAMWEAILAARAGAAASPSSDAPVAAPAFTPAPDLRVVRTTAPAPRQAAPGQGAVRRLADRRWVGLAAAASLLLATGVGLGRWWGEARSASAARDAGVVAAPGAQVATTARTARDATSPSPADRSAEGAAANATPDAAPDVTRDVSPDGGRTRGVDLRGARRGVRLAESATASAEGTGTGDAAYDVASLQHFTAAEALLVSYRSARTQPTLSDSMSVALDGRLSTWARQLLQDTRLLLDSPAGTDPRRRQLLEDLELVLAQITRLGTAGGASPSAPAAGERAAIDGTLQRGQVLSRLRTAIPSGT